MWASRQPHRELAEFPDLALDRDRATMLLRDDVVADREPQAGAFPGRLCREERLEKLVLDLAWDADAVIAHPDLDRLTQIPRRHFQHRAECTIGLALALAGSIEAVADQIEEHARHVLRHDFDRGE